ALSSGQYEGGAPGAVCHLPTGAWWTLPPAGEEGVLGLHFLADGRTLMAPGHDGVLHTWDLGTRRLGRWVRLWAKGRGGRYPAVSPLGGTLASGAERGVEVYRDWVRLLG